MIVLLIIFVVLLVTVVKAISEKKYKQLESEVLNELGFYGWGVASYIDSNVIVKSRQALEKYDVLKFFKEDKDRLTEVEKTITRKAEVAKTLKCFLENNNYKERPSYSRVETAIKSVLNSTYLLLEIILDKRNCL